MELHCNATVTFTLFYMCMHELLCSGYFWSTYFEICVFQGAVKRNPSFTAPEKDVTEAVRKWLVNSRDREGYRTQRRRNDHSSQLSSPKAAAVAAVCDVYHL